MNIKIRDKITEFLKKRINECNLDPAFENKSVGLVPLRIPKRFPEEDTGSFIWRVSFELGDSESTSGFELNYYYNFAEYLKTFNNPMQGESFRREVTNLNKKIDTSKEFYFFDAPNASYITNNIKELFEFFEIELEKIKKSRKH